jgi:hypothetical protein
LFVWPLLFLLIGEAIAFGVAWYRDQYRPREAITEELTRARTTLLGAKPPLSANAQSWVAGLFTETIAADGSVTAARADQILETAARADTQADLDKAIADAKDIIAIAAALPQLRAAAAALSLALATARPIDPEAGVFARASDLLAARAEPFATAAEAKSFLADLNDQLAAIEILRLADRYRDRGLAMWHRLPRRARTALATVNPAAFWGEVVSPLRTKKELEDAEVIENLGERNAAISGYLDEQVDVVRSMAEDDEERVRLEDLIENRQAMSIWLGRVNPAALRQLMLERTGAAIRWPEPGVALAVIRRFDRLDFFVATAVATAGTFATLYVGKNFGTGWDYLAAVVAGAVFATATIQLLPWYRKSTTTATP